MLNHGEQYIRQYKANIQQIKLIRSMRLCRTPALGWHRISCKTCGKSQVIYLSCGNNHCPICQQKKRDQWIEKFQKKLLEVPYVHIVTTLPVELRGLAKQNKGIVYEIMLKSTWQMIKEVLAEENQTDILAGATSVLHTFGSDMKYHVHVHSLVSFGGLDTKTNKWQKPNKSDRIAPYKKMKIAFRKQFMHHLEESYNKGEINYHKSYQELEVELAQRYWVVHNTEPTVSTKTLENYLSRYINRIAVSSSRVKYLSHDQKVELKYKDYTNQKEGEAAPMLSKQMDPLIFIEQFMQHILPPYFHKTRHWGLHHHSTAKKYKETLKNLKRTPDVLVLIIRYIKKLLQTERPKCRECNSYDLEISHHAGDRKWLEQYIPQLAHYPRPRPPTSKRNTKKYGNE